jgi:hypothetical protein
VQLVLLSALLLLVVLLLLLPLLFGCETRGDTLAGKSQHCVVSSAF